MMAPAAQQLVLSSCCPTLRASAPLSLVALRRAVRGRSAWADAEPLSVRDSALFCSVASRRDNRRHLLLVECRAVTGCPNLRPSTGLKLGALLLLLASLKSRNVFLCLLRPTPRWGGLAFLGFDARRILASGGRKPERACAPSLGFSGISRRTSGLRGPASAMSPSLKGDGDA